jgi:hypothetical protein
MLSVFFPFFHANGGADYSNAPAAPLFFLTWALAQAWAEHPRRLVAVGCGVAAASTLHTSPLFLMTGPLLAIAVMAVGHERGRSWRDLWRFVGLALAGFVLTHVAFAAWHAALGRNWAFYMPQYHYVESMREDPTRNIWWEPFDWRWARESTPNAFMFVVALLSLAEAVRLLRPRPTAPRAALHRTIHLGWLFIYVAAVVYQFRGQTTLHPDYLGHLFNACTLLPLGCVIDAAVVRGRTRETDGRWWQVALPVLCVAVLYIEASWGRPFGVTAFAWTIAATGLYYLATWTPLARGSLALVALPIVNASLLVYPSFYKVDLCHEVRHLNTVMVEASTIGSRFVDHPDDLFVWTDGRNPKEVLTHGCFAGITVADFTTSFRSVAHRRLGEFTDENPFEHEDRDEGHLAFVTALGDGFDQFAARMLRHGVHLTVEASYQDPPSGLRIYVTLFTQDGK